MEAWLIEILNQFGYLGISFLIAIENVFPPIPSEVILTFSGFMTTKTSMTPFLVIVFSTIGALLGAYVLYYIGSIFSEERIYALLETKIGKILGFKKENIHKTITWFQKNGKYGTFIGRCIPIIRSLISIPAGMAKMPILEFTIYTTLGSALWNTILVLLGSTMGKNWNKVVNVISQYSNIILYLLIILFILFILYHLYQRHKRK